MTNDREAAPTRRRSWTTSKAIVAWIGAICLGIPAFCGILAAVVNRPQHAGDELVAAVSVPASFQIIGPRPAPVPSLPSGLIFVDIVPIVQPVNQKFLEDKTTANWAFEQLGTTSEMATFCCTVFNDSSNTVQITRAELIVGKTERLRASTATAIYRPLIPHDGHIPIPLGNPGVASCIPIPLNLSVASKETEEFTVWFQLKDEECDVLRLSGAIRLHCAGAASVSRRIKIEVHAPEPQRPQLGHDESSSGCPESLSSPASSVATAAPGATGSPVFPSSLLGAQNYEEFLRAARHPSSSMVAFHAVTSPAIHCCKSRSPQARARPRHPAQKEPPGGHPWL